MSGIRVVTDSAADLPVEILARHGVTVVPLDVRLGDSPPEEMRALTAGQFWERAGSSGAVAETSAPSPGAFKEAFLAAARDGAEGVVCVTISSDLSGTYQSAITGAAEVAAEVAVRVVDSRTVTMGEGFLVLEAAEQAERGADLSSTVAAVESLVPKIRVLGALDSLDTLRRGGRIGSAQAFFGSLLSIKPVIEVRNGIVEGESRQRTRTRALRYLADKAAELGPVRRLAVAHAAAVDLGAFLEMLSDARPDDEPIVTFIGPVIGAHAGPGTIGICLQLA